MVLGRLLGRMPQRRMPERCSLMATRRRTPRAGHDRWVGLAEGSDGVEVTASGAGVEGDGSAGRPQAPIAT